MTASPAPDDPSALRFPRSARVLDGGGYKRAFSQGRRVVGRAFHVHVFAHDGEPRLGLAVSRRVHRNAVVRNRIKRIARDVFRIARAGLRGGDYIVTARHEAVQADAAALRAELVTLLDRAASLKPRMAGGTMPPAAPPPP